MNRFFVTTSCNVSESFQRMNSRTGKHREAIDELWLAAFALINNVYIYCFLCTCLLAALTPMRIQLYATVSKLKMSAVRPIGLKLRLKSRAIR